MVAPGHELQSEREEGIRTREWARGSGVMRGVVQSVEEEAGGGQGKQEVAEASRARATPRLCLLAEEDDRGGEWRWAGPCWAR